MSKTARSKRSRKRPEASIKGKLFEQIVLAMHKVPGLTVRSNVKIPAVGGKGRRREIDVLIESTVAGYPVRIAIECKNIEKKIDPERIDAFVGKLNAVGIPVQHGIYIAANGYTKGALDWAATVGIRPLVLTGLTADRVAESVAEAFESIIYLLLSVDSLRVSNDIGTNSGPDELLTFYDESGKVRATVPDLLWRMWRNGDIPRDIGTHEIEIPFDPKWHLRFGDVSNSPSHLEATVKVLGVIITIRGKAIKHLLVNAIDEHVEKAQISAAFVPGVGGVSVCTIQSENELKAALKNQGAVKITYGRFPLPRILLFNMYWPPSERTIRTLENAVHAHIHGRGPDPRALTLKDVEGTSIDRVWDPVWQDHHFQNDEGKFNA